MTRACSAISDIGGLFTGVDVDVNKLGQVLDGTSYSLAYLLMKIDANACVQAGGNQKTKDSEIVSPLLTQLEPPFLHI